MLAVACFLAAAIGVYWVASSATYPQADQEIILNHARDFNAGDFWGLEDGQYLSIYPQQLGMVTFLRGFSALFGDKDYLAFQYFTALMLPCIVLSGMKVVRYMAKENIKAELYYIFFVLTCFPMYGYTPFVYGDLCSLEFGMLSVWLFLSCLEVFSVWKLLGCGIFIGTAVLLRENVIILAIAMGIVVAIKFLCDSEKRWHALKIGIVLVLGVISFQASIKLVYMNVRDTKADAIPASTFIVMGLNDDYGHAGWDNWYSYNLFYECGKDAEDMTWRAVRDLKSYIDLYKNNPSCYEQQGGGRTEQTG